MLALRVLWIFTVGLGIFIGTTLIVCLVVTLLQNNQAQLIKEAARSPVNRDRVPIDCFRITRGDEAEQRRAIQYQKRHQRKVISTRDYIRMTNDCGKFIEKRGYFTYAPCKDEENFPLAFDMLVSKDIELFERLLRTVYRPQNVYCVHVDKKAEATLQTAVRKIAGCFENVFLLPNSSVESNRGLHLVPEPDIRCMEALLNYTNWMYFISLKDQEFPLRTNWELVRILKNLKGATIIDAQINLPGPVVGNLRPAIDVSFLKAPVRIVARRHFVQFLVNDDQVRQTLNWTEPVRLPSRFYVPGQSNETGTSVGEPGSKMASSQFINQYKVWQTVGHPCRGNISNGVCAYGIGDLPMLASSPHFFARIFNLDFQPLGLDCLEELIFNRTKEQMNGDRDFNTCYYECLLH